MKIKLSAAQWKQVIYSLNASVDCQMLATAKPIARIIDQINKEIPKVEIPRNSYGTSVQVMFELRSALGYELEFSGKDVDIIIDALTECAETKRIEIDDEVVAVDVNDTDEPIADIKEHLSNALAKANEVETLELIRKRIEKQQDEQTDTENKQIAFLTTKVDTLKMIIEDKDREISSLKSAINDRQIHISELEHRLGRYEPPRSVRDCPCPVCRPRL